MLFPFKDLKMMGVINITPNSFSETTSLLLENEALKKTINKFKNNPRIILDIGFESTAPMNSAISEAHERERFDYFFEATSDINLNQRWISFDTYRPENFRYFEEKFKTRYTNCGFIFNDVSGVVDEELLEFLKSKNGPRDPFYYLCNNTHIPNRASVLEHIKYASKGDAVDEACEYFIHKIQKFKEIGVVDKIILDPGFGFSKTYDQNWDLLNRFEELIYKIQKIENNLSWLIGISKKSFLRKSLPLSSNPFEDSEVLHAKIIRDLSAKNLGHLIFRAHNPYLLEDF